MEFVDQTKRNLSEYSFSNEDQSRSIEIESDDQSIDEFSQENSFIDKDSSFEPESEQVDQQILNEENLFLSEQSENISPKFKPKSILKKTNRNQSLSRTRSKSPLIRVKIDRDRELLIKSDFDLNRKENFFLTSIEYKKRRLSRIEIHLQSRFSSNNKTNRSNSFSLFNNENELIKRKSRVSWSNNRSTDLISSSHFQHQFAEVTKQTQTEDQFQHQTEENSEKNQIEFVDQKILLKDSSNENFSTNFDVPRRKIIERELNEHEDQSSYFSPWIIQLLLLILIVFNLLVVYFFNDLSVFFFDFIFSFN